MTATYVVADVRDALAAIPDGTVDLVLTSPPFLALRSYLPPDHPDKHREIGSEPTPAAFLDTLLGLSAEWRRILAPHGTLAVELGDTYSGSGGAGGDYADGGMRDGQQAFSGSAHKANTVRYTRGEKDGGRVGTQHSDLQVRNGGGAGWPLAKSLSLVPEAYRLALAYGHNPLTGSESPAGRWRVRNVVDWCRPNPPVGALGDKFRPSTSDLVIACTSDRRWFDLDAVRTAPTTKPQRRFTPTTGTVKGVPGQRMSGAGMTSGEPTTFGNPAGAPPLDHWIIPPGGYRGSHYAVFPPELCRIPIEAMCPRRVCRTCGVPSRREVKPERVPRPTSGPHRGGANRDPNRDAKALGVTDAGNVMVVNHTTGWSSCGCPGTDGIRLDGWHRGTGWRPGLVLDPFGGSGTTGLVATGLGRDALLIDLDARNLDLARERLGMFLVEGTLEDLAARDGAAA